LEDRAADGQPALNPRKVKIVPIGAGIFEHIFRTGYTPDYEVTQGLPDDARLVGARHDPFTGIIQFLYSSDEFDEVEEGEIPPVFAPVLKNLTKS
jgi:hypothetical protein